MRVYRAVYQARSSIEGMWRGNPILTALLFGLPAGFLTLICYSICCQDIMDADEEDEGVRRGRAGGAETMCGVGVTCYLLASSFTSPRE